MNHMQHMLAGALLLGASSLSAHAELLTKGVGVLDTNLNIIFTQDANLLGTLEGSTTGSYNVLVAAIIAANKNSQVADSPNYFDGLSHVYTVTAADFQPGGMVDYWGAIAFVKYLNFIRYGGSNQWALPAITADDTIGFNQTGNAFGELFYTELGGVAGAPMPTTNAPFINIREQQNFVALYWFGSDYNPNANYAWVFNTTYGNRAYIQKAAVTYSYVWPVRPAPNQYTTK